MLKAHVNSDLAVISLLKSSNMKLLFKLYNENKLGKRGFALPAKLKCIK